MLAGSRVRVPEDGGPEAVHTAGGWGAEGGPWSSEEGRVWGEGSDPGPRVWAPGQGSSGLVGFFS